MIFAPIFAGLMALWPPISFLGALGYTPLLVLSAVFAAPFVRFSFSPRTYVVLVMAFVIWANVTWAWSAANTDPWITGHILSDSFAIKAGGLRLLFLVTGAGILISAMLRIAQGRPRRAAGALVIYFVLHGLIVFALPWTQDVLIDYFYEGTFEDMRNAEMHILRNANGFAMALAVLVAWAWSKGHISSAVGAGMVVVALASFVLLGSLSAVVAVFTMVLAIGIARLLPKRGFKVLFGAAGLMVLFTPAVLANIANLIKMLGLELPASTHARAYAWHVVGEKILEKPLLGHGLEASSTWHETYATRPEWLADAGARGENMIAWGQYQIVPGHTHNMAMEIWSETGVIGAALAAFALISLGWRLPSPQQMATPLWVAAAGLFGTALPVFCFSYSAWNDAVWAGLILLSASAILIAKAEPANRLPMQ
ncbi:MAG: O-antigen ligase family protein [Pseudomonadota bacterium]